MSSILRALKKLESEPQHLERPEGVDSKYISLAGPEHRTSTVRPLLLFIGGGIACGMVILIGWWFMHDRLQTSAPATQQSPNIAKSVGEIEDPKAHNIYGVLKLGIDIPVKP